MPHKHADSTSLKSPILGMWFFRLFPSTFPELEITTAVFHRVPCKVSRSRIGEMMTMLCFLANWRRSYSINALLSSTLSHFRTTVTSPLDRTESCSLLRPTPQTPSMVLFHGCRKQRAWLQRAEDAILLMMQSHKCYWISVLKITIVCF